MARAPNMQCRGAAQPPATSEVNKVPKYPSNMVQFITCVLILCPLPYDKQKVLVTNLNLKYLQSFLLFLLSPSAGLAYMAEVAHATGPALLGPRTHGKIIFCARFNNRPKQRAYNAE